MAWGRLLELIRARATGQLEGDAWLVGQQAEAYSERMQSAAKVAPWIGLSGKGQAYRPPTELAGRP